MVLQLLQTVVGFLAGLVTIAQMFTGVFLCRVIQKKGSTRKISSTPFIGGLVISLLLLQQSRIIENTAMKIVNLFGAALNSGYIAFYYHWAKAKVRKQLLGDLKLALAGVLVLILYSIFENSEKVEHRYGLAVTIIILAFVAAPFRLLPEVIRKKSAEDLPYPMIVSGLIVSLHWLVYSILIWNKLLFIQNAIATIFCIIQFSFFGIYPDKSSKLSADSNVAPSVKSSASSIKSSVSSVKTSVASVKSSVSSAKAD